MNERQMQFRVGVMVFATMIIGGLLGTLHEPLTGWLPWGRLTYEVGIKLREAPGVAPNTPVRKNGILIGRVDKIEDQGDGVLLKARIDGNRPLYPRYVPTVRTTVLGDATIDFKTAPLAPDDQPVPDGYVFNGGVAPNPFDAIADFASLKDEFASAARSLGEAGDEVSKLAERVNKAFGDETEEGRVSRLMETTENAMHQFSATMAAFNEIIGDVPVDSGQPIDARRFEAQPPFPAQPPVHAQPPAGVQPQGVQPPGIEPPVEGPEMRRRLRQGLNELPDAIREFRQTLELADRNLRNLEGFTEPLGQKGEAIADALIRAVDGVDRLIEDFNLLVQALNSREGTIGRLIHEPQTYENLNRLMCNANTVLGQIHELAQRLRPVVEDARTFMDKLAREPGRVVTGGLNPSPIK
jgi:phospholipid/cholesterol/gamma-HCH transport system substrate-binding protein